MDPFKTSAFLKDWEDFKAETEGPVLESSQCLEKMRENLKARLFPSPWKVFAKISALHSVVGFLSLGICSQFDLNPFHKSSSLADVFMRTAGHNFCMVACGVLFLSLTFLFSNAVLSLEELESVRRNQGLQVGVLSLSSLAAFAFFGAEVVGTVAILWFFGAWLGGSLCIEGSWHVRHHALRLS